MTTIYWPHRGRVTGGFESPAPREARPVAPIAVDIKALSAASSKAASARGPAFVFAGGGTGGHIYPGLAIEEAMRGLLGESPCVTWAATNRPVDQRLLSGFDARYVRQAVQPLPRGIRQIWPFVQGWSASCRHWNKTFQMDRPAAVVALGGYAAAPAAHVATRLGIPLVLVNPDAVPGIANRYLMRRAQCTFTQWELPAGLAAKARGRVVVTGCPIRPSLLECTREDAWARLGLRPGRPTLVVTGASLGAQSINGAIVDLLADEEFAGAMRRGGWQVLHLTGAQHAQRVVAQYKAAGIDPAGAANASDALGVKVIPYCNDMAAVWAAADLAITRAGAGTCAELSACGVPSILMPYPWHKDKHQHHNAMKLVDAGAAIVVADTKDAHRNAAALQPQLLRLLGNAAERKVMARLAKAAGKPLAALEIAKELLSLVGASAERGG